MSSRPRFAVSLFLLCLASPLPAQAPRAANFVPSATSPVQDSVALPRFPRTYWLEGARLGALAFATSGAVSLGGWCRLESASGRCAGAYVGGAVLGALIGYGVGAFVGSLIPQEPVPR